MYRRYPVGSDFYNNQAVLSEDGPRTLDILIKYKPLCICLLWDSSREPPTGDMANTS